NLHSFRPIRLITDRCPVCVLAMKGLWTDPVTLWRGIFARARAPAPHWTLIVHACASLCLAGRARRPSPHKPLSHAVVVWAAAAFGWNPGDDLVRVGDVAGFAVD